MFWNLFKKKQEPVESQKLEYESLITYASDVDGDACIDIHLESFDEDVLDRFAKLIVCIFSMSFSESTIATIKRGFEGHEDKYEFLMRRATYHAKQELSAMMEEGVLKDKKSTPEDPCIKPSEMIK